MTVRDLLNVVSAGQELAYLSGKRRPLNLSRLMALQETENLANSRVVAIHTTKDDNTIIVWTDFEYAKNKGENKA